MMQTVARAVSAVLVHDQQLLMVHRQPSLNAFPGYHAFPGGKVDDTDPASPLPQPLLQSHEPQLIHALIRELKEELDFDLPAAIEAGNITDFSQLCIATTPAFLHSARFQSYFFRIDLNHRPQFTIETEEIAEASWSTANQWMDQYRLGRLLVVPPIRRMLEQLEKDPLLRNLPSPDLVVDEQNEVPCFEALRDLWHLPVRSNTLPPASRTNAFVIGDLLVDPSPRSNDELERLLKTLARFPIGNLMLTHHHGDHNHHADAVARELNIPILLSEYTYQRMSQGRRGRRFFKDIQYKIIAEGDVVTSWLTKDVLVHEVPGHDQGQLALAPRSMEWYIVGDLIQGIGTVVIAAPEGNMRLYFQTLQRVIDQDPAVIIPSHGIAMGGTFRLQDTLKHRELREQQVLELALQKKSKLSMLRTIYKGLDLRLMPLAMANIEAHLKKLREEQRI